MIVNFLAVLAAYGVYRALCWLDGRGAAAKERKRTVRIVK